MFDKLKDLNALRKQALQMKKILEREEIIVEEGGIKIVITGDQKVKAFYLNGQENKQVQKVINLAIQKSQRIAAQHLARMSNNR